MSTYDVVARLRDRDYCSYDDTDRAADMLEFLLDQLQMHSPKMDGNHSYRFRGGWPMTHAIGPTPEDAVRAALKEVERQKGDGS